MPGLNANLVVTYDPAHAATAKKEIESVLKALNKKAVFEKLKAEGLFAIKVSDPKGTAREIAKLVKKKPKSFVETFHYIPIEKWTKAEVKEMQACIRELSKAIGLKEKWKMELNKRSYGKHNSLELIRLLTDVIDRQNVDLDKPEKVVRVEIIGKLAGISVLGKDEMVDVPALK